MRALLLPVIVLLALATGLGLLAVATTLSQAPLTVAPATTAATAAVQRFYAAADLALQTGDPTPLQDTVVPDYTDHARPPASPTGLAGYAQFLTDLRTACSDCRLTGEALAVSHDQAAVRVTVRGHHQGATANVAVDGVPLVWSALDVLRIADGQVAERWSRGDPLALTEPPVTTVPEALTAGSAEVPVTRFVLPPGTDLPPFTTAGPAMLVVEQGTVALSTDGLVDLDPIHLETTLAAGRQRDLMSGLSHRIRNDGSEQAVVLVLATAPVTVHASSEDGVCIAAASVADSCPIGGRGEPDRP